MILYHLATLWAYGIVSYVNFTLSVFLVSCLQQFPIFIFFYTVVYIPLMFPVLHSTDTFVALLILKLL